MKKWMIIPALAGAVAIGGVALANDSTVVDAASTKEDLLTLKEAKELALQQVEGKVTEIELETDDGRKHYDIEIKDGTYEYDLEIDAITGKVLKLEKDRDDDKRTTAKTSTKESKVEGSKRVILTKDQAIAIAMKQAKGKVTDFELDDDDDRKVYEIEIEDGKYEYEFEIDAFTGEVLDFEKDREDD